MMDRAGFDRGLIRYASESNIENKEKFRFTGRLIAYSVVLSVMVGVLLTMIFMRNDIEATVLRLPGQTFMATDSSIKNIYTIKLINKTTHDIEDVTLKLLSHKGKIEVVGGVLNVGKQDLKDGTLFIEIEKKDLNSSKEKLEIGIYSDGELIDKATTNFSGPLKIK